MINLLVILGLGLAARPHFDYKLMPEESFRVLQSSGTTDDWEPIRIMVEYISGTQEQQNKIKDAVEIGVQFFSKLFLVQQQFKEVEYSTSFESKFFGITLPSSVRGKKYEADFILFINVEYTPTEQYLAFAGPLYGSKLNGRPVFAIASANLYYIPDQMTDSMYETVVETVVHEMIHAFGFLKGLYNHYFDSVTGEKYKNATYFSDSANKYKLLATPRLLAHAKKHYKCPTLLGVQMENVNLEGTAESHFERTTLMNEMMTGSDLVGDFLLTDFTFQLLQDTGFYRLMEYEPDPFYWGEGQGCDFVEKQCLGTDFEEFCNQTKVGCSHGRSGVAQCGQDMLIDKNCRAMFIMNQLDCRDASLKSSDGQYFGFDSMCFDGSLSKGAQTLTHACYQYECSEKNELTVIVDGIKIPCLTGGKVQPPSGYNGNLECPRNPSQYCKNFNECPNQCNKRGICMKGKVRACSNQCNCMKGFSGVGCEQTCTGYQDLTQCVEKCPDNTYALDKIQVCVGCPGNCAVCASYKKCTKCKEGYELRGDFCDIFFSFEIALKFAAFLMIVISF